MKKIILFFFWQVEITDENPMTVSHIRTIRFCQDFDPKYQDFGKVKRSSLKWAMKKKRSKNPVTQQISEVFQTRPDNISDVMEKLNNFELSTKMSEAAKKSLKRARFCLSHNGSHFQHFLKQLTRDV